MPKRAGRPRHFLTWQRRANPLSDDPFYQPADKFFPACTPVGLTYDDITLATLYSDILPRDTQLDIALADGLQLNIPVISSDMDTVTESRMAIAMALNGGLGLIHYNMPEREQLSEVSRVKNHVHGLIQDPVKVAPDQFIGDVLKMIEERKFAFGTFPVVEESGKLVGLLSGHVVKPRYAKRKVADALTPRSQVHTIEQKELGKDPIARADKFFTEHLGIHKLLVVDDKDRLRGLITLSDVERLTQERSAQFKAARDAHFRLVCGAAISATRNAFGELDRERILNHVGALVERGLDAVAVSTAHGHSKGVGDMVRVLRDAFPKLPIIAGNVTSAAGVDYLADAGANAIKVGQGPGSICTTRIVAGVGIPQMTALYVCSARGGEEKSRHPGGRRHHEIRRYRESVDACRGSDLRRDFRRLQRGAGRGGGDQRQTLQTISRHGQPRGDANRVGGALWPRQESHAKSRRRRHRGAQGSVRLSGRVLAQLIGGIQSGMGYLGAADLTELREKARYIRVSPAGMREAAPHDVVELKTGN